MDISTRRTKRCFTDAARAAALAARQAKALLPKGDGLDAFVVRDGDGGSTFAWEVRRFGGVVLEQGSGFSSQAEALVAGRRALAHHLGASRPGRTNARDAVAVD